MPNSIQILSVQSDEESRAVLKSFLGAFPDFSVQEAMDSRHALESVKSTAFDVVLLDSGSRVLDAIELTERIRQIHPSTRVVVLTATDSPDDIFAAMNAGADGYILKSSLSLRLEAAIRSVKLGTVWLDPEIAKSVLDVIASQPSSNSPRELPTGVMRMPFMPHEKAQLEEVAGSNCVDGVCMVDPSFVRKLRRFAPATTT